MLCWGCGDHLVLGLIPSFRLRRRGEGREKGKDRGEVGSMTRGRRRGGRADCSFES